MTTAYAHRNWSPIGAMELKCSYHRNMIWAVVSVILFFAAIVSGLAVARLLAGREVTEVVREIGRRIDAAELGLPASIREKPTQIRVTIETSKPVFAIPEAADDNEVVEDYVIAAPEDFAKLAPSGSTDLEGVGGYTLNSTAIDEYYPPRDTFVPYDEKPVTLLLPAPKYPEMARKAGIEGTVYVEVLIDKLGKVRDARVIKESGANAGFEEAALEAAWKGEWRPAMQNKQPVAVRVSYPVTFRLK